MQASGKLALRLMWTPIRVNQLLGEADVVIGVGQIVPHRVMGYTGGATIVPAGRFRPRRHRLHSLDERSFPRGQNSWGGGESRAETKWKASHARRDFDLLSTW